ncbi:MAG TPA: hypothetical protein DHV26_01345 [Cytophagales bacterium]|nr:hypothetical protein [Cytophagales bacterium]HRG08930.1 DUF4105 domain-containing protein [Cyclobacteriaceae bacterium]
MQRFLSVIVLLLSTMQVFAQEPTLSDKAEISIITCGPDPNELYSAFGHSAVRVIDPVTGIDYAFNYGVFDFDQPNFYLNFARGRNYYLLAVYNYIDFERAYKRDGRFIHEQVLQLTPTQRDKIYSFLLWNAQPENRTYRYDYYHDNCATRIRDILVNQLAGDLKIDSTSFSAEHSFRQKTDEYLGPLPWGDLGIDICLGLPIDRTMHANEYMFLPDYLESFTDRTQVKSDSGWVALVKEKRIIAAATVEPWNSLVHPWLAFFLLLMIIISISFFDWKRKKLSRWFDVTLFGLTGLIGLLLFALWLFTDHHDAARNFNLLWAFPLHLFASLMLFSKRSKNLLSKYFLFCLVILALTLVFWWALPQELNVYLISVAAGLAIRCLLNWRLLPQIH